MLLRNQQEAVAQAWLDHCNAEAELHHVKDSCNEQCRNYFSKPSALLWPFAAGVLLARFKRSAPQAVKVASLAVSIARLALKMVPLARQWMR